MTSQIQKLNNIISTVSLAEKEHKQVFVNEQGELSVKGKLDQLLFDIKALVKGSAWKNEQFQLNNQKVIDVFTKAVTDQLVKGNGDDPGPADLYSKSEIRRFLLLGQTNANIAKSPLGSLGAAREARKLPSAQNFINALNHITKNRNAIDKELQSINSIWIDCHRNGLPIHEEEFLILRNSKSTSWQKIEAKGYIQFSLENMQNEMASLDTSIHGMVRGINGALNTENLELANSLSKSTETLTNRFTQLQTVSQILKDKLREFE